MVLTMMVFGMRLFGSNDPFVDEIFALQGDPACEVAA